MTTTIFAKHLTREEELKNLLEAATYLKVVSGHDVMEDYFQDIIESIANNDELTLVTYLHRMRRDLRIFAGGQDWEDSDLQASFYELVDTIADC